MDAFAWTVIGSLAGVVCAAVAVFGLVPLLRGRRQAAELSGTDEGDGQSATQPSWALLPPPVLDVEVRGRGQVVDELAATALAPSGLVQVLSGLGGLGKSTVARAVAARIAARHRRIWWVPAADAVSVTQVLLGLAEELGASRRQVEEARAGRLNPSDVLWEQLEDAGGWTLVLDNADDPAVLAVGGRLASSGSGWLRSTLSGLVLITSRTGDPQAWGPIAQVRRLEPLDEADGAQVLLDLAPGAGDRSAARSLSAQLGGLPLALHQAGSYLASPFAAAATFARYQQALCVRFAELMGRGADDRARVIATWELSLDALTTQGVGQVRPLLRALSCFADAVPVPPLLLDSDVLAELCGSVSGAEDGLSGLLSVGLIDMAAAPDVGAPGVKVHPLVAQTIRYRAAEAMREFMTVAVKLLNVAVGKLEHDELRHAADWLALVPHLRALQVSDVKLPAETEASLAGTAARLSLALLWGGFYVAALEMAESGLERSHGLPEDHEMVLQLRRCRASTREFLGRYAEAETEFRQVLAAQLRVRGNEHPDTLTTRHSLATVLAAQGKPAKAEDELRKVLRARQRVLGPDHPSTLATRHEIARILADQGKPAEAEAEAEAEYQQVLAARLQMLGPDHPSTLVSRHDIARMLDDRGKPVEAEAEYRQVLAAQLRVLSPEHPDILTTRHNIAHTLAAQGQYAAAETEYRQVLAARQGVFGPDHPSALATRQEIGYVMAYRGKPVEAEAEYRRVLAARLRVLGRDHPDTLITRHEIARMLAAQGMPPEAEAEFRQVLAARRRVLGADHSNTLATRHEIAHVLAAQGKLTEANAEYRQVLETEVRVLGADHPSTLTTRDNLAALLAAQGKPVEAEAEFRQILAARQGVQGPDHPSTLTTRFAIAGVLAVQGKLSEAEAEFRQVLAAQRRVLGLDHPDILATVQMLNWLKHQRRG